MRTFTRNALALCATATLLAGCSGPPAPINPELTPSVGTASAARIVGRTNGSRTIQHVVIIVQEARSFDNLFCGYAYADASPCAKGISLKANCKLSDTFGDYEYARKTGDFSHEKVDCPGYSRPQYRNVLPSETKIYRTLANRYVLGDHMFSSTGNPTFESHQYYIAAQADDAKNQPFGSAPSDGCVYQQQVHRFDRPAAPACETYKTLATELQAAGLQSAYYAAGASEPTWDAFGWVKGYSAGTTPPSQFLRDVGNGKLGAVTWVTPELKDSDLSGSRSSTGPAWVASLINAVGESSFWNSTAIFVTWSGYGGWADHVAPPFFDRDGLGFRVPLLVISPYAKKGYVTHVGYESASVLRFAEEQFGLEPLSASDARAKSPSQDCFDFSRQPRPFVAIPTR